MNINISYTLLHVSGVFELWSFKGKVRMLLLPNSDLTNINIYKRCSLLRIRSSMYACMYVCMHACIHVCCLKQILTEAFKDVFRGIRKVQRAPIKTSTSSCVSFKGCFCASGLCLHKVCSRTLLFHIFSNNNKKIWFGIRRTNKSNSLIRGFCYSVN